jgi:hypothetical protein
VEVRAREMDLYERLSRMLMRRKYSRVENTSAEVAPLVMSKSKSVKVPREKKKQLERSGSVADVDGLPVVLTNSRSRRNPLRSSNNEAVDSAWFNNALRRSVAEGRLHLGTTAH